jgi:hypothetical protein
VIRSVTGLDDPREGEQDGWCPHDLRCESCPLCREDGDEMSTDQAYEALAQFLRDKLDQVSTNKKGAA